MPETSSVHIISNWRLREPQTKRDNISAVPTEPFVYFFMLNALFSDQYCDSTKNLRLLERKKRFALPMTFWVHQIAIMEVLHNSMPKHAIFVCLCIFS